MDALHCLLPPFSASSPISTLSIRFVQSLLNAFFWCSLISFLCSLLYILGAGSHLHQASLRRSPNELVSITIIHLRIGQLTTLISHATITLLTTYAGHLRRYTRTAILILQPTSSPRGIAVHSRFTEEHHTNSIQSLHRHPRTSSIIPRVAHHPILIYLVSYKSQALRAVPSISPILGSVGHLLLPL